MRAGREPRPATPHGPIAAAGPPLPGWAGVLPRCAPVRRALVGRLNSVASMARWLHMFTANPPNQIGKCMQQETERARSTAQRSSCLPGRPTLASSVSASEGNRACSLGIQRTIAFTGIGRETSGKRGRSAGKAQLTQRGTGRRRHELKGDPRLLLTRATCSHAKRAKCCSSGRGRSRRGRAWSSGPGLRPSCASN